MRRIHRRLIGSAAGLVNLGLYLAFTSDLGIREIIAGAIVAGLATAGALVFSNAADTRFEFRLRDLLQAWRLPAGVIADSVKILHAVCLQLFSRRGVPSMLAAVRFDAGENRLAEDAGRRALAITYNSATPNSIIVGIVEEESLLIYHQLIAAPISTLFRNLGARP